jgi:hypothetical protein
VVGGGKVGSTEVKEVGVVSSASLGELPIHKGLDLELLGGAVEVVIA